MQLFNKRIKILFFKFSTGFEQTHINYVFQTYMRFPNRK